MRGSAASKPGVGGEAARAPVVVAPGAMAASGAVMMAAANGADVGGDRLGGKIRVRLLEREDSLAELTGLLHRAYKVHVESGLHALAGFQPEAVTRKRIEHGECFVATYLGKVVGTILFKT